MTRGRRAGAARAESPPLSPLPPPTVSLPPAWKLLAALLVAANIGFSVAHLRASPILPTGGGSLINAPDESAHLGYVHIVAQEHRLPTQADAERTYEWHQPPLYYLLAAAAIGVGDVGARAVSIILGAAALAVIFVTTIRLFPNDPRLAVTALGVAALLPMRQAVYAAAGNDSLTELLFSLTLLVLAGAFSNGLTLRRAGMLGAAVAAAILTKATGLLLIPIVLAAIVMLRRGGESPRSLGAAAIYAGTIVVSVTAFWFLRNLRLYGELTPLHTFMREFANTSRAADWIGRPVAVDFWSGALVPAASMDRLGYLNLVANWSFRTFAAAYTTPAGAAAGIPRFMPAAFYLPYAAIGVCASAGLALLHHRRTQFPPAQRQTILLLLSVFGLVSLSFGGFVWTYFQAQGRYVYPAMLPISILTAMGIRATLPDRYRDAGSIILLGMLFVLALAFITTGVVPAYGA